MWRIWVSSPLEVHGAWLAPLVGGDKPTAQPGRGAKSMNDQYLGDGRDFEHFAKAGRFTHSIEKHSR